jgi:hypothetical protein
MSPNTLRRIWKEKFGEEVYRERGRVLQARAASEVAKRTAGTRTYRDVMVPCCSCKSEVRLSIRQTAQMKDLGSFLCRSCMGFDRSCPVCEQQVNGKRGLSSHFRHRREDGDRAHISYEEFQEEALWSGKVEGQDFVRCLECGHRSRTLARHLKAVHGITAEQYRGRHGKGVEIRSQSLTQRRSQAQRDAHAERGSGAGDTKVSFCTQCGHIQEVSKFACDEFVVCAMCQYKAKESHWEALSEPDDYVSCWVRGCSYRAESLVSHIQNAHPELVGRYLDVYPEGHICSLGCDLRVASNKLNLTKRDLSPFMDEKGRVQVSLACVSLGVAQPTVNFYCKQLGLPTRNRLAFQKEVLDRCAEVLQESYVWEWSHPKIFNSETGYRFYFDGYFEKAGLVVEVHGKQHFEFVPYWHKTRDKFEERLRRDQVKRGRVLNLGLRYVMFRWDEPFRLPGYVRGRLVGP